MYFKINLPVDKSSEAIPYYKDMFGGEVIKEGKNNGHAYIKLFNELSLHVHSRPNHGPNPAYFIIRFEEKDRQIFDKISNEINQKVIKNIRCINEERIWGTNITQFTDKYGYNWVLEIDTKK